MKSRLGHCSTPRSLARAVLLALVLGLLVMRSAEAHPVSLLWSQIQVHKDRIEVELIVTVEEFYYVYELPLDDDGMLVESDVQESVKKYEEYLLEQLTLRDPDGNRLEGEVTSSEVASAEFMLPMEREVTYKVNYPLEMPLAGLEIVQTFGGVDSAFPSVMTVEIEQVDFTLPEPFMLEKDAVAEIEFDWLAPPLTEILADPEALEKKRREMLGITSFGSVYTFFYIEEQEVRHEILLPVATLETWLPIEREKESVISVEEQRAAHDAIFEFFAKKNPVTIDGIEVAPKLDRIDFFDLEFKDLAQKPPERPVPVYAARVGIILRYPAKGIPDEATMQWELFSRDVREVRTALIAWDQSERVVLENKEAKTKLVWTNPGRPPMPSITSIEAPPPPPKLAIPLGTAIALGLVPFAGIALALLKARLRTQASVAAALLVTAAVLLVGPKFEVDDPRADPPAPPADADAQRILASLHENIYRAFDYRNESEIYDSLERSVAGELLAELYLSIRKGLLMQEQGGAVSRVETVEIEATADRPVDALQPAAGGASSLDPRAFARSCQWTVAGTVEHWGHIHARTNRYTAEFLVEPCDGAWKITGLEVGDQEKVKFETSIRKVL